MAKKLHILNVVGARPNFMKVAPLMRAYAQHPESIRATLVHTGQHYDASMSDVFFADLGLPTPDMHLNVGSGSHAEQTAKIMVGFEKVMEHIRPDVVVVAGDVNSTLACAVVAAKLCVPVAHIEAGLRSRDRTMPEEINRIVTDALADILLTTSPDANENLCHEGVPPEKIFLVGNTMIDSLNVVRPHLDLAAARSRYNVNGHPFGLITLHRPSNVDHRETLTRICDALEAIQQKVVLLWPVHPRSKKMLEVHGLLPRVQSMRNLRMLEPYGYTDSIALMTSAALVITDSGGVQEETTALGVPCLTVRENTERPITITEGTNELVGSDPRLLTEKALAILRGEWKRGRVPALWDGNAAPRIVDVFLRVHGLL